VEMICRPQLPDSDRLYYEFTEKQRDVQDGADLRGTWKKTSSQIERPHRDGALRGFGSLLHVAGCFPSKRSRSSTAPQYCRAASRSLVSAGASAACCSSLRQSRSSWQKTLTKHLAPQRLTFREVECRRSKPEALMLAGGPGKVVHFAELPTNSYFLCRKFGYHG
jgi:hypothetical protein